MHNVTQPHHKAQIAPFAPAAAHSFSGMHAVQSQANPRRTLYACQFEPPLEGALQVVDRFMLQDVDAPPAAVFEVRNLQRQPPSAYLCSYRAADLRRAQERCQSELIRISATPKPAAQAVAAAFLPRDPRGVYPSGASVPLPSAAEREAALKPHQPTVAKAPAER